MIDKNEIIDVEEIKASPEEAEGGRKSDGGSYLVIADESEEVMVALRYSALTARAHRAKVIIAYIIHVDDFQHWQNVEEMMRKELREQAEKFLWKIAEGVNDLCEFRPSFSIREGDKYDEIVKIIKEDKTIRSLILGGNIENSKPGSLVSYFTGKGFSRLHVPVMIVPSDLEDKGFRH